MKRLFFLIIYSFWQLNAQNLVPNPSFEDTIHCPTSIGQLDSCQSWINPTHGTPDYFNACSVGVPVPNNGFGSQSAHSGVAYAGFYTFQKTYPEAREYIQTSFSALILNHKYSVSFYVSLSESSQYALSSIGAYFSSNPIVSTTSYTLNYIPQIQNKSTNILSDKTNWMLIADTLYANGGEQYVTIGNFKPDNLSDTLYLGFSSSNNISYYYIDDISVIDLGLAGIDEIKSKQQVNIYPNPAKDILYIEAPENYTEIRVTDVLGNEVLITKNKNIDVSSLKSGVYFITITSNNFTSVKKVVKQ